MNSSENLDSEELYRLAIAASDRQDTAQAISLFKRAIAVKPDFAYAHYLLGAEHAQLGMFDRAAEEMALALKYAPDLHSARFQLGLIELTSGKPAQADQTWSALSSLGDSHYFVLFRDGLLKLARDDFEGCKAALTAGIQANTSNVPLNADMEKILKQLHGLDSDQNTTSADAPEADSHLLVNAYSGYRTE